MSKETYDFQAIIPKFDAILQRGLCRGVGKRDGQMCIEAAICAVLDLPHGDDPQCVEPAIRAYKIRLNDSPWSSPRARADGLRDLGIAQIGSRGIVDGKVSAAKLAEQTIRVILPVMIRETPRLAAKPELMVLADSCEREGSGGSALELRNALYVTYAAAASAYASATTAYASAAAAIAASATAASAASTYAAAASAYAAATSATAAATAAYASAYDSATATATDAAATAAYASAAAHYAGGPATKGDQMLRLSASLALQILIDLNSPGAEWIDADAVRKLRMVV